MWEFLIDNREWLFSGAGLAVLTAGLGLARLLRRRRAEAIEKGAKQDVDFRFFAAPRDERYNREFYHYFTTRIAGAKSDIYITGEGFECADDEGTELARQFVAAHRQALRRGVRIVRVQTRSQTHHRWANMLADLLSEYPETFVLYALREGTVAQMSSVCVIDPEYRDDCVVEIMLSTERLFGTKAADLAGTAVFIERSRSLACDLRQRILSLKTGDTAVWIRSADAAVAVLSGDELYFAYGSNMKQAQMTERAKSAKVLKVGFLPDHRLVFNREGSYRPGGVASVEPESESRVYGVIYRMSGIDFAALDETEDPKAYRRTTKEVLGIDGSRYMCHVYEAIPTGQLEPDPQYLETLISAAQEADLPPEYIQELEALRSDRTGTDEG